VKTLETNRLILRKFSQNDFAAVHSYGSNSQNMIYMMWGPNTENDTRTYINTAIKMAEENPCTAFHFAAELKETGAVIGGCTINMTDKGDNTAEIGWLIRHEHWQQGYGFEMGKKMLEFGFEELGLNRIFSRCDAENIASYRLMEKLGMRREGLYFDNRPPHKQSFRDYSDGLSYAMLKVEWDVAKEIAYYNSLPVSFTDFVSIPTLADGDIFLICTAKRLGNPEKKHVPSYHFAVCKGSEQIGEVNLRIGYGGGPKNDNLYYGGHVGYTINEAWRGNNYAARACKLLAPIARAHGMTKLLITNTHTNIPSRRVCEKLGARHIRLARLPEWNDLYIGGQRFINIFEWNV